MCSLHGFEKSVLMEATKDSSAWALQSETGNILNNGTVHPKKPSKALLIRMIFKGEIAVMLLLCIYYLNYLLEVRVTPNLGPHQHSQKRLRSNYRMFTQSSLYQSSPQTIHVCYLQTRSICCRKLFSHFCPYKELTFQMRRDRWHRI
ncbi:hypothetical protein LXL04_012408 [Taraxacum kok-saghyz]